MDYINQINAYYEKLKESIDKIDRQDINKTMEALKGVRDNKHYIFIMGNGGSVSTASPKAVAARLATRL